MIFEIDFNRTSNDEFLIEKLGAKQVKDVEYYALTIYVKDFEHLEKILDVIDEELGDFYSAVVSFDPPTIYLDNKV
jgi:predicted RNase H-like nuclease